MTRPIYEVTMLVETDVTPGQADLTAAARALAAGQPSQAVTIHSVEVKRRPGMERYIAKQRRFRAAKDAQR